MALPAVPHLSAPIHPAESHPALSRSATSSRATALLPTDRAKLDAVAQNGRKAEERVEDIGVRAATPSPDFDGADGMTAG
jgi:hypothetical protein